VPIKERESAAIKKKIYLRAPFGREIELFHEVVPLISGV
jgi:hypothetical protein